MSKNADNPQLQQMEFFPIPSPCIGVCEVNPKGFCKGCFRSREERLYWPQINDAAKRIIVQQCKRRAKAFKKSKTAKSTDINTQSDLFEDFDSIPDKNLNR